MNTGNMFFRRKFVLAMLLIFSVITSLVNVGLNAAAAGTVTVGSGVRVPALPPIVAPIVVAVPASTPVKLAV